MKAPGTAIEPIWEEKRENPRFAFSSTVMFEDYRAGTCHDGRMMDHSRTGMRFETGVAPELGAEIFIGMDRCSRSRSRSASA
jgi:hypothetical protein